MLSGVSAECGVRGAVDGDMGEAEGMEGGAGEVRPGMEWEGGGAEGGGIRALSTLADDG